MTQNQLQREILIEQKVNNNKKSRGVAYLLWFILGALGVHRFYLGKFISGAILLIITLTSFALPWFFLITGLWCLVDLFLIPSIVTKHTDKLKHEARLEVLGLE